MNLNKAVSHGPGDFVAKTIIQLRNRTGAAIAAGALIGVANNGESLSTPTDTAALTDLSATTYAHGNAVSAAATPINPFYAIAIGPAPGQTPGTSIAAGETGLFMLQGIVPANLSGAVTVGQRLSVNGGSANLSPVTNGTGSTAPVVATALVAGSTQQLVYFNGCGPFAY